MLSAIFPASIPLIKFATLSAVDFTILKDLSKGSPILETPSISNNSFTMSPSNP